MYPLVGPNAGDRLRRFPAATHTGCYESESTRAG